MPLKMEQLASIGLLVMIIGFVIVFLGIFMGAKEGTSKTKVAVGGFIGFIPFGFANDKGLFWALLAIMSVFLLFWVFVNLRFLK